MELKPITQNENKTDDVYASSDCQQLLQIYDDYYPKIGFNVPWIAYFVMKDDKVVGTCSFVGQPQDGKVEIAYWTFNDFEGQGVASFACSELVKIAQQTDPNIIITAKTSPEKNASTTILAKNNFVFTEVVQDDEIGDAWLWTHTDASK